ncbi:AAA family ATPase [Thermodesulfobacteriota bacterium]
MYSKFYGLSCKPFELTPDPDVIFLSETHQEAISVLRYGVLNRKGFLQVTGDVGTGKSTLLQSLIHSLQNNVHLCYIPNPNFTVREFYYFVSAKFGLDEYDGNKAKFILSLGNFLQECKDKNEHALLIIDEAQVLSLEVLEEIRLISNQEAHDVYGVLSIFLVGQPEFNALLDHKKLLPLKNRIGVCFHIAPLSLDETIAYIQFRLQKAGRKRVMFSPNAYQEIHKVTGGIPRTINILCDNALLAGFVEQRGIIDEDIVRDCAGELRQAEKNIISPEEKPEQAEIKKNISSTTQTPDGNKKRSAFIRPGIVGFAVALIFVLFISMAATTEYWGEIPGAGPIKNWLETLHLDERIPAQVKEMFVRLNDTVTLSTKKDSKIFIGSLVPEDENNKLEKNFTAAKEPTQDSPEINPGIEGADEKKIVPGLQQGIIKKFDQVDKSFSNKVRIESEIEGNPTTGTVEVIQGSDGTKYVIIRQVREEFANSKISTPDAGINNLESAPVRIKTDYVSITPQVDWANIRSGPTMKHDILRSVPTGFPLHILEKQESWSLVEDFKKRKGWVANNILVGNNSVILKVDREDLRDGPNPDDDIVDKIDYGKIMLVVEIDGDWLKVINKEGFVGWLQEKSIWP